MDIRERDEFFQKQIIGPLADKKYQKKETTMLDLVGVLWVKIH